MHLVTMTFKVQVIFSIENTYISFYKPIIVIRSYTILKILTENHYIPTVTFQGHPRSKVMVPNEILYMHVPIYE